MNRSTYRVRTVVGASMFAIAAGTGALALVSAADDDPVGAGNRESGALVTRAIEKFWSAYHGNDYGAIPTVQRELTTALRQQPNNPTLYALLGATHFWHIGEASRDRDAHNPAFATDMPTAASLFGKALNLDYYAEHPVGYANDDHLPGYLGITTVHMGQMTRDPALIAQGDSMLEFAVYQFPEFNNFNRWAAHNSDPKDSPQYKRALASLWEALDACVGTRIDHLDPDIGPFLHLQTAVGRKKSCWSRSQIAPHSLEGFMLNLGNGLVKAGEIDAAATVFADAKYADNYASWPYRDVLEQIASSDLNARAALYADNNPQNDPPLSVPGRGCVYCHATVPER
jgi:hypothetical protein